MKEAGNNSGEIATPEQTPISQTGVGVETIVAVATPAGRGGIGVVRLSGPLALAIAGSMLRLRQPLAPGRARFGELLHPSGERMDEVVATYFAAPRSYTGEDVVEIALHGAPVLLADVVRRGCEAGARLAEPGEFTERAFLSGRLDLTQAEAVRDLIEARTLEQVQTAARQMGGALAAAVAGPKQQLIELIATLEAGVDFAEDDIDVMPAAAILSRLHPIHRSLTALASTYRYGRVLRDGATLALIGRPNVGKSSLFNRLVERERAIVTAEPGTTRDLVSETISLGGIPIELVDTAGMREAESEAERLGIDRSHQAAADADIVLLVLEAGAPLTEEEMVWIAQLADRPHITLLNKVDLRPSLLLDSEHNSLLVGSSCFLTSTVTGEGLPELRTRIQDLLGRQSAGMDGAMITNLRQQQSLESSIAALSQATTAIEANLAHECVLLDLYTSLRALDTLTGQTTTEEVLQHIFSTFCIGK
jgi:tRNA modification GTPase